MTVNRFMCIRPTIRIPSNLMFWLVGFMVFNATFSNISVISRRSVILVGEKGVPGENHGPTASH